MFLQWRVRFGFFVVAVCLFALVSTLNHHLSDTTSHHFIRRKPAAGFVPAEFFSFFFLLDCDFASQSSLVPLLFPLNLKWINNINPNEIGYISFGRAGWIPDTAALFLSAKPPDEQWRWQQPSPPPPLTCPRCCYYSWPLRASGKFPYDEPEASALRWGDFHKAGHSASALGLWWLTSTSTRVDVVATFPAAPRVKRAADAAVLPPPLRS